jgi:hypothetical protein
VHTAHSCVVSVPCHDGMSTRLLGLFVHHSDIEQTSWYPTRHRTFPSWMHCGLATRYVLLLFTLLNQDLLACTRVDVETNVSLVACRRSLVNRPGRAFQRCCP